MSGALSFMIVMAIIFPGTTGRVLAQIHAAYEAHLGDARSKYAPTPNQGDR